MAKVKQGYPDHGARDLITTKMKNVNFLRSKKGTLPKRSFDLKYVAACSPTINMPLSEQRQRSVETRSKKHRKIAQTFTL